MTNKQQFAALLAHPQPKFTMCFRGEEIHCMLRLQIYTCPKLTLAVKIIDAVTMTHYATASVNVPDMSHFLPRGQFFLKDYAENEGLLEALVDAGVIVDTDKRLPQGFVSLPLVELCPAYMPKRTVYVALVRDQADFGQTKTRKAFGSRAAAARWASDKCDEYAARDRANHVDECVISYDYTIWDMPASL